MRHITAVLITALLFAHHAASGASEPVSYKSFVIGQSYPTIAKMAGMKCNRPVPMKIGLLVPKGERDIAAHAAKLRAAVDGDLVCRWDKQTIAGKPIQSARITLYNDVVVLIELSLQFPLADRNLPISARTGASADIRDVADALTAKYGEPKNLVQYGAVSMSRDYWFRPDGEIMLERRLDRPYAALVTFTAKSFEAQRAIRIGAASDVEKRRIDTVDGKNRERRKEARNDL